MPKAKSPTSSPQPRQTLGRSWQSLPKSQKLQLFIVGVILAVIPLTVYAILSQTNLLSQAAPKVQIPASVQIMPNLIINELGDKETNLSALAYDTNNQPIWNKISYQWSISTTNSIGTLDINSNDKLATFVPSTKNRGRGDIFVKAVNVIGTATGSIAVYVGVTPAPSPTPDPCLGSTDGTKCTQVNCPVCPAGQKVCSKRSCTKSAGICKNQQCAVPGKVIKLKPSIPPVPVEQ